MKVFFVAIGGKPWWTKQHTDAMEALGWEVYPFTDVDLSRIVSEAVNFKPDLLFYFKHPQVTPDMIDSIKRKTGCRFVQFNGDHRGNSFIKEFWNNRELLNMILINNSAQQDWYEANGFARCREWHIGVYPPIHKTYPVGEEYDVSFGGNAYRDLPLAPERKRLVYAIDSNFKLLTIGNWDTKYAMSWITPEPEYCQVLCKAKITLGINHFDVPNYYTRRLWLCLAIGKLHLTRYIPGMERDFKKGVHLDWFFEVEEAVEMVRYYLNHEEAREKIGKEGQKLVYEKHKVVDRYKELEKMLKEEGLC